MTNDAKRTKTAELEADKEFKHQQRLNAAGTAEEMYCAALREELSVLQLPGSPDIECRAVPLQDAFVSLSISENWRSEHRFADREKMPEYRFERHLSPEQAMKRAFQNYHLLLVIGDPGKNLANYNEHVGATTPVDRYPEGATPLGLMDMAGNVWEWMENYSSESKEHKALRGGAYYSDEASLVCSARDYYAPDDLWFNRGGFRVLRASHP